MYHEDYPGDVPARLRRVLGKFMFFDWPPSFLDMTKNATKTALRYEFTDDDIDVCTGYIDRVMANRTEDEMNAFWNSLHTQVQIVSGNGGRRILEAIREGLTSAKAASR